MSKGKSLPDFSLFSTAAEEKTLREIGVTIKFEAAVNRTSKTFPVDMKDKSFTCICISLNEMHTVNIRVKRSEFVSKWSDKVKDIVMLSNVCTWNVCLDDADWERKCFVFILTKDSDKKQRIAVIAQPYETHLFHKAK